MVNVKHAFWQFIDVTISFYIVSVLKWTLIIVFLIVHRNNYNSVCRYVCFYHFLIGWNYIIYLTHHYWRKHLTKLSYDVSSWVLKIFLDRLQRSRHLQVIILLKLFCVWCETVLYLLVSTKTLMLAVDRTCGCTNGMTIPYLTYWTYDQVDVLFC